MYPQHIAVHRFRREEETKYSFGVAWRRVDSRILRDTVLPVYAHALRSVAGDTGMQQTNGSRSFEVRECPRAT